MIEFDNKLYAASINYEKGAKLYCSANGATWADPIMPWSSDNDSVRTMAVDNGLLYVGTENNASGGELWVYDGTTWKQKGTGGQFDGDPALAQVAVYGEKLYVGTWDFGDNYKLFMSEDDGVTFIDRTPVFTGSDSLNNLGVMKLVEFGGDLYLGTVNYRDGFTLLRTDNPSDVNGWEVITTNGFDDPDNAYSWSMQVMGDTLYLGTFNSGLYGGMYSDILPWLPLDGRAELWYLTEDGDWAQLVDDGFGSMFTYGFRTMTVSDDRLFVGTASNFFIPDPQALLNYLENPQNAGQISQMVENILASWGIENPDVITIDVDALRQMLEGYVGSNWIGCEVYASNVPEPSTLVLLCFAFLTLAGIRRKF